MDVLERLKMPPCDKTRVPLSTLEEQLKADAKQKKLLSNHIASMYLVSLLNEQTVRIRAYKDDDYSFQAVYVFEIELKANDQITVFTELVHSAFPESTLLILRYKDKTYLSGASKRINKLDKTRTVLEDSIWIEVPDGLQAQDIKETNLREYYESLIRLLYRYKVLNVTGVFPVKDGEYKSSIKQYEQLMAQINKLKEEYSASSMRNEKMRIDEELYKREQELKQLKERISGGQK